MNSQEMFVFCLFVCSPKATQRQKFLDVNISHQKNK